MRLASLSWLISFSLQWLQPGRIITDPLSQVTKYTYSLGNLLTEIEYADGNKVRKKYDQLGRLIQQTEVSTGLFDKYEYDANSNLVKHVDRSNQSTTYVYNHPRDFLMKSITASETISYTYDAEGKRLSMQDATGLTAYQYKPETGQLTKVTYPDGKSISYTYDTLGRRTSMTGPFGNQLAYGYDSRNRLEWVGAAENNREATYTYLKNGLLSAIQQKNGVQTSFTLDGPRVTKIKDMLSSTVLNTYEYGYDLNSNLQTRSENGTQHAFTYDKLNRIDTSTLLNEKYTYDARGNRQTLQSDGLPNLQAVDYQYDDRNRLTKVTTAAGVVVSYKYNGDGLLWERTENSSTTRYYYDGADVIAEGTVTAGVSALQANYIRGNGLIARADASGTKAYYLHNAHGDVTGLRDSSGNVLNTYSYDIWGNPLTTQESVPQPFRYSGELWDSTTSLQYLRARWYDPSMGRFINEDTYEGQIDNPLSLNLYTYVYNNPLTHVDPTGNSPWNMPTGTSVGYRKLASHCANVGLGTCWNEAKAGTIAASIEVANFMVVDDINTLLDPNSSTFDITLAAVGFIPIGKFVKGGRLIVKLASKEGREIERAVEATAEVMSTVTKLSNGSINYIGKHIPSEFANQVPYLPDQALKGILSKRTFFNPSWSKDQIIDGVEKAYADALSKGALDAPHSFEYLGETINVFVKADGTFDSAYGLHKLDPSFFGK